MRPGSTLRFRVEDAQRGVESSTWSLVGAKRSGDLYFAGREIMGDVKLSLHESGIKRMAWTEPTAEARLEPGADRASSSRWTDVEALGSGWSVVLRVDIPDSALSRILPPLRPRKATVTIPAAGPGRGVHVRVLLGEPDCGDLRLEGKALEVGRMVLGDGSKVWVTAWDHETTPDAEARLSDVRARAVADGALDRPVPRAWAWGRDNDSGIPFVLDAGDPRPVDAIPEDIPRYDGPPEVVVVEIEPRERG